MRGITLSLLVAAIGAGVVALPAAGKEGVRATLLTKVPLDAEPGTQLKVAWKLTYAEGDRRTRPFGANGVFVRLLSASGARARSGFAPTAAHRSGEYAASVIVPEGGIGDVEFGLRGWTSGAGGSRRADLLFPITNDPVPASARVAASAPGAVSDPVNRTSRAWLLGLVVASLFAACIAGLALGRRKRASPA